MGSCCTRCGSPRSAWDHSTCATGPLAPCCRATRADTSHTRALASSRYQLMTVGGRAASTGPGLAWTLGLLAIGSAAMLVAMLLVKVRNSHGVPSPSRTLTRATPPPPPSAAPFAGGTQAPVPQWWSTPPHDARAADGPRRARCRCLRRSFSHACVGRWTLLRVAQVTVGATPAA